VSFYETDIFKEPKPAPKLTIRDDSVINTSRRYPVASSTEAKHPVIQEMKQKEKESDPPSASPPKLMLNSPSHSSTLSRHHKPKLGKATLELGSLSTASNALMPGMAEESESLLGVEPSDVKDSSLVSDMKALLAR